MQKSIKKKLNDLALKKKLLLLIMAILLAMSAVALISVEYIYRAHQEMMYRSVASSLEYLSLTMENELNSYLNISSEILADNTIQNILSQIKDRKEEDTKWLYTFNSRINKLLDTFFYENEHENLLYISIINPVFTSDTSFKAWGNGVPKRLEAMLSERAVEARGRPVWITGYSDQYGLLAVRNIRRIDELLLDDIGTIVMAIDIQSMIEETIERISLSDDLLFALYDTEGEVFLCSEEAEKAEMTRLLNSLDNNYGVVTTSHGEYFISKGNVGEYDWGYSFAIAYDDIVHKIKVVQFISSAAILLTACAAILIANQMVGSITKHFERLLQKMIAFGKDDSVLPKVGYDYSNRKDEIASLHNQFDCMAQKIITLINENYKNELLKKDMEFKALQSQMNPHFLYNTLNTIHWKAKAAGENEISEMVQALAKLLRSSLESQEKLGTIRSELEITKSYITIQTIRYGERLIYKEEVEGCIEEEELPLLTIQPIIENAVRYGLEECVDSCEVALKVFYGEDGVYIQVWNSDTQFEENFMEKLIHGEVTAHGFGIGILNIHRRIQMTYGENYGLNVFNPDLNHAMVQIKLPRKVN